MIHSVTGLTVVEYVPPPKPEERRTGEERRSVLRGSKPYKPNRRRTQRRRTIEVPEKEGIPTTTLTVENGMTIHLHREAWDRTAADHYAKAISEWLNTADSGEFIGLPSSRNPDLWTWLSRYQASHLMHIHDQVSVSPTAGRQRGGSKIVVPQ